MFSPWGSKWSILVLQQTARRSDHNSFHSVWSSDKVLQELLEWLLFPWKSGSTVLFTSHIKNLHSHLRDIRFHHPVFLRKHLNSFFSCGSLSSPVVIMFIRVWFSLLGFYLILDCSHVYHSPLLVTDAKLMHLGQVDWTRGSSGPCTTVPPSPLPHLKMKSWGTLMGHSWLQALQLVFRFRHRH